MKKYSAIFFIPVLICVVFAFVQCKKNNSILESNDPNTLWDKDTTTIERSITGKWKWYRTYQFGFVGVVYPINTFVDITKDSVIIIYDNGLVEPSSYNWVKKRTPDYITYVMRFNNQYNTGWYFGSIKNDSLYVGTYSETNTDPQFYASHLFIKIN